MPIEPYTLNQAEEDIANLRGQVDALTEYITTSQMVISGPLTATGGTVTSPSVIATDTWNTVTTLNHGWGSTIAYTLLPLTDLVAVYVHLNASGATTTDGTQICSFPGAYRPASTTQWMPMMTDILRVSSGNTEAAGIFIDATGSVQCQGIAAAATWVRGTGMYRLSL